VASQVTLTSTSKNDWMMVYPGSTPGTQLPLTWAEPWTETSIATATMIPGSNMFVIWKQANQICEQPTSADAGQLEMHEWNETSFDNPPWLGIKVGKATVGSHLENCLISSPQELK
jgi:hypothetical protein